MMELTFVPRLGFGFDIEHNDTNIHIIGEDEDEKFLGAYEGLIVKIPFLSIYWGEFEKFDKRALY